MHRIKTVTFICVMLLNAASHICYCQYFSKLYDFDSTYDWGVNIFIQQDSILFVTGTFQDTNGEWALTNMRLSANGNVVLTKHKLQIDSASLYQGIPGEVKMLPNGDFISPLSIYTSGGTYGRQRAGYIRYNSIGDTVLLKTYTDTSNYYDGIVCAARLPDGGYLLGGSHEMNIVSYYPALLIRTDSVGDTLWTRTFQQTGAQTARIVNIIPLSDGRIVIAAMSTYVADAGGLHHFTYDHKTPWFMILDSLGNSIKDTLYNKSMLGNNCGSLYPDRNGGYIHIGHYDSLFTEYPDDWQNFPSYVTHLDTNFRITWITELSYSQHYGSRHSINAHQLQSGNFVINGEVDMNFGVNTFGWAAKIEEQTGKVFWNHVYYSDTNQLAYLTDMAEKSDGNLVFVGKTFNDTLPIWRANGDIWLVGVDSNGCLQPGGCDPNTTYGNVDTITEIKPIIFENNFFTVYPNPTNGSLTITSSSAGTFIIYTLLGQQLQEYTLNSGDNNIFFSFNHTTGIYIGKFISFTTGTTKEIRLIYRQ